MIRLFLIFILSFLLFEGVSAQKANTLVYYLKNSGKFVSTKDSADFILAILPPDSVVDKKLYIIKEFYPNGKLGLIGNSKTNTVTNLKFQGVQITYFPNGHKSSVKNFENGRLLGDVKEFYPSGKLYNIRNYTKTDNDRIELKLNSCNDSTGKQLAINGNGNWIKWNDSFDQIIEEGQIENGLEEGEWRSKKTDSSVLVYIYKGGQPVGGANDYKSGIRNYFRLEIQPEFPGGLSAFTNFLTRNIRYPDAARVNHIQGRVIVSFVVDNAGNLTDIKIVRGIGSGCDEEAARVMRLSPPWKPGRYEGKPVRVAYSVPIAFNLGRQ
jgi:TonB family protein